ncbi:MAG: RagB/SusD family nutrient uptake outer membrane protein [Marinifilaceae bacterium]
MTNTLKIFIPLLSLFIFSSCEDFFSEVPDSRIELDNLDEVSQLLTNAYPDGSYLFLETMTDNVGAVPSNMQLTKMEEAYNWENISMEDQDTPSYYWSNAYNGIAHANQALKSLKTIEGDKSRKDAIEAEALLVRAYSHFMLVNLFAKHYDPATAAGDLGVPYITEPEVNLVVSYKRETVEKTYQLIENDLLEGLAKVSNKFYAKASKYHFTREAALAFASRFYLYKGDYATCLKYSQQLLGENYNPAFIKDYKAVLAGQGPKGRAQRFSSASDQSNLLLIRKELSYQLYYQFGYRMTQKKSSEIYFGDSRSNNMWSGNADQSAIYQSKFESLIKRESSTATSGRPYTIQPVLRGEEVFFNQLESQYQLASLQEERALQIEADREMKLSLNMFLIDRYNGPANDPTTAEDDTYFFDVFINFYRSLYSKDYPDYTKERGYKEFNKDGTPNKYFDPEVKKEADEKIYQDNRRILYRLIMEERRREFAEEGLRWFDIRRLKLEVTHVNLAGETKVLKADDSRKVLQIPNAALINGIEGNAIEEPAPVAAKLVKLNRVVFPV